MKNKIIFVYVLASICMISLEGMQKKQRLIQQEFTTPKKGTSSLLVVPQKNQPNGSIESSPLSYISEAWLTLTARTFNRAIVADPSQSSIIINFDIITYLPILQELKKAKDAGVTIKVFLSPESLKYIKEEVQNFLVDLNAKVFCSEEYTNNHLKLGLWKYTKQDGTIRYWSSVGSSNMSFKGLFHNNEINEVTSEDEENFNVLKEIVNEIEKRSCQYPVQDGELQTGKIPIKEWDVKKRKIVEETPHKKTFYGSHEFKPWESFAQRFKKLTKGDEVIISSFTYNDPVLTEKIIDVAEKGVHVTLFVGADPLGRKENFEQIMRLLQKNVKVYVFLEKRQNIHHAKFGLIDRHSDGTHIVYGTSQNISKNNRDIDIFWLSDSSDFFKQYKEWIQNFTNDEQWELLTLENIKALQEKIGEKRKRSQKSLFAEEEKPSKKRKLNDI
jgi:hypothetical protein